MLTAIFGFMKTVVVTAVSWIIDTVKSIMVDSVLSSVFN